MERLERQVSIPLEERVRRKKVQSERIRKCLDGCDDAMHSRIVNVKRQALQD
ncbi:MAG: hypothetical protein QW770_00460 [Candidatus Bathyarchaeia archaeon]